jgi:ligand-binding SRPBCC domain-containing protein
MRLHFQAEQDIPYPLETVFCFFADPANLPRLMPAWQNARIDQATYVAPPLPPVPFAGSDKIIAGNGTRLTITIRPVPLSPIRVPWEASIEDFHWLSGFCDVQLRGPFRYWRHCHTLHAVPAGTRLRDAVAYELPLGPLSGVANALFVRHQLAATFRFRQRRTLELLAAQVQGQATNHATT